MRTYVAEEQATIENGIYPATVQKIEDAEGGQYGPAYKFIFDVQVEDETQELSAFCADPEHFTPRCKLRRWGSAILGHEIQDGERFSPKMLVGKPCRVLIENVEKETGTFAKVKDVYTVSKPKAKKTSAEPEADDENGGMPF